MNVRPTKTIDLTEYGMNGCIKLAPPTFRKRFELQNNIALNCVKMDADGNGTTIPKAAWINLVQTLAYVVEAPFTTTVDGFLAYADKMDETNFGSAEALISRLREEIKTVDSEVSPFVKSDTQATEQSE